jgi:hypothetical protein
LRCRRRRSRGRGVVLDHWGGVFCAVAGVVPKETTYDGNNQYHGSGDHARAAVIDLLCLNGAYLVGRCAIWSGVCHNRFLFACGFGGFGLMSVQAIGKERSPTLQVPC